MKDTKSHILEVTQNLMSEKGYSNVSMSDIAKKVGIAKSSLYYYFPDKESLYGEIITLYIQNAASIYEYKENEKATKEILSKKIKKALTYGIENGGCLVSFENVEWSTKMAKKIHSSFDVLYKTLYETLKYFNVKNPEFSVHIILDMSYSYIKKSQCGQKIWSVEKFTKLLIEHLYV